MELIHNTGAIAISIVFIGMAFTAFCCMAYFVIHLWIQLQKQIRPLKSTDPMINKWLAWFLGESEQDVDDARS